MKKRFWSICLILITSVWLLTGCISAEERAQAEEWRKQGEKNAVTYVKQKYGFEAEVVSSDTQKVSDLFGARLTSKSLVTMEYDGKEFGVLIEAEQSRMDEAADNYQKEEVEEAFTKEVTKLLGTSPDRINMKGGDNVDGWGKNGDAFYNMYFHEYYDGENLEELICEYRFYCVAETLKDIDLDSLWEKNENPMFESKSVNLLLVTYDSEEDMEKCNIHPLDNLKTSVYEHGMFVSDALFKDTNKVITFDFEIKQCGDFYYLNVEADPSRYSIREDSELYEASEWNGHGFNNATAISDTAYYLEGDTEYTLYIYYPKEKFAAIPSGEHEERVVLTSRRISNETGKESYDIFSHTSEVPDYEVFWDYHVDSDNYSFRLMYNAQE